MFYRTICEICGTSTKLGNCDCGQNYFGDNKIYIDNQRIKIEEKKKMAANDHQVGGDHYRKHSSEIQHWDYAELKQFDKWQYQITKYVERWKDKNGILDLEKARHFLDKYIEVEKRKLENKGQSEMALNDKRTPKQDQEYPFGFNAKIDSK